MASLAALALLAEPALAGSSLSPAEVAADSDVNLTLTITEPDDEAYGDTATVTIAAPSSFAVLGCQPEPAWDCSAALDEGTVTFSRTVLGLLGDATLQFSVRTAAVNGTYAFSVRQADDAEEPATVRSAPKVTVTGGQDPAPPPDEGAGTDDGDSTQDGSTGGGTDADGDATGGSAAGGSTDTGGGDSDGGSDAGGDDGAATGDADTDTDTDADGDAEGSDESSSGTTTPRSTQGRSNATTLEITPGEPIGGEDPVLAEPDVADEPAVAPPADDADTSGDETPTMTAIAGDAGDEPPQGADGLPWQQLLGGTLLVAGGAIVAIRRWDLLARLREAGLVARVQDWDLLGRIRRWRGN